MPMEMKRINDLHGMLCIGYKKPPPNRLVEADF
jgi:hypothetical protein